MCEIVQLKLLKLLNYWFNINKWNGIVGKYDSNWYLDFM